MRKVLAAISIGVVLGVAGEAAAATRWSPYNTCWQDFDVGGNNWFCGLRTTLCSNGGELWCTTSTDGMATMQRFTAAPLSKKVALDANAWAWLWTNNNKLYHETPNGTFVQFSPTIPLTCVNKIVVAGIAGSNPRILALGCNGEVYRFLDGTWTRQFASGMVDISVTATGSTGEIFTVLGADNRLRFSGSKGGGIFSVLVNSTRVTETWTAGGGGSYTHTTSLLAGYNGVFGNEFFQCHPSGQPIGAVGAAMAYSFSSFRFVTGDPRGCDYLQPNPGDLSTYSPRILKAASSGRGPGDDKLWILTNQGRVSVLVAE